MKKIVLSVLVDNTAGVLSRVSGLFSRRGYNIDSLTVGETENKNFSKMTIVAHGEDEILEQIYKQVAKLEDVREVIELQEGLSVTRELILCKVEAGPKKRQEVVAIADIFRAKIVDVSDESLMVELTGNQSKLDAFIGLLGDYKIKELVRTGVTGLRRGKADMLADEFD